jgi:23S rRNA (cytosine1962-C5)-methyltransferase
MRELVGSLSHERSVLNCFSYTGGFSVYAARGVARTVDSLDISAAAIEGAKRNFLLNDLSIEGNKFLVMDAFDYLRAPEKNYDLIVLDPPAFAKKKSHIEQACKGYNEINRLALQALPKGGLLLTCSCSHYVDESLFKKVIFQASRDAHRDVRILQKHRLAFDHPLSVFHPEGEYIKSLLLYVD